ncbi:MAG TPA: outer membrane protein assembly factor BamE [Oleiagrimonas sp.]|nr:outer membrane protein assembly factor BamE [Oleiagrimonas sp.]
MRTLFRTLTCTLLAVAIAGCGLVYHPPLQQGNLLDKKTVDKLKPGMTKRQVIVLMGSPSIASPFDHDRWDYVHAFAVNGGKMQVRKLTLFFNNDALVRTEGSLFAADNEKMLKQAKVYDNASSNMIGDKKGDKATDDSDDGD